MINFRWGLTFAAIALVFSLVLGIISGVSALYVVMRCLVFTLIFFGLGVGIYIVIQNFFPELLFGDDESPESINFDQPGTHVNITLGGVGEYAIPEKSTGSGGEELGNIEDLISGVFRPVSQSRPETRPDYGGSSGIDLNQESVYNDPGSDLFDDDDGDSAFTFQDSVEPEDQIQSSAPVQGPVFTPSFGDDSADGLGGLPDLDSMAGAFSGFGGTAPAAPAAQSLPAQGEPVFEESEPMVYNKGNKAQPLEGDFDPKSLAEGIRTVLTRDK